MVCLYKAPQNKTITQWTAFLRPWHNEPTTFITDAILHYCFTPVYLLKANTIKHGFLTTLDTNTFSHEWLYNWRVFMITLEDLWYNYVRFTLHFTLILTMRSACWIFRGYLLLTFITYCTSSNVWIIINQS